MANIVPTPYMPPAALQIATRNPGPPPVTAPFIRAWQAAEQVIDELRAFEAHLDDTQEVALGLVTFGAQTFGEQSLIHVREIRAKGDLILAFHGDLENGYPVVLVQHLSQLNLLIVAAQRLDMSQPKRPIGFISEGEAR